MKAQTLGAKWHRYIDDTSASQYQFFTATWALKLANKRSKKREMIWDKVLDLAGMVSVFSLHLRSLYLILVLGLL
jgi:hypothetical protein